MQHHSIPFEEILIKLDLPGTQAEIKKYSPAGRVPALIDGDLLVWDSLAIMEYLHERFPEKKMYPADLRNRTKARSIVAEMHSGFQAMREHMSFHAKKKLQNFDYSSAEKDVQRVKSIWDEALQNSKGPFLFGDFSIADAMYAPVVGRFETYGIPTEGRVREYCKYMMQLPAMQLWYEGARAETFRAENHE